LEKEQHIMSFWQSLRISASGLLAQRLRLDTIANNIANAQTTRTQAGGPYQRQDVVFMAQEPESGPPTPLPAAFRTQSQSVDGGVRVAQITTDNTPGTRVYDPTHPDADQNGYVTYPNVNPVVEMTNMVSATRSYEANLAVVDAVKTMALKALDIAR
jgi:flagellar basal-body rod protein FlgC